MYFNQFVSTSLLIYHPSIYCTSNPTIHIMIPSFLGICPLFHYLSFVHPPLLLRICLSSNVHRPFIHPTNHPSIHPSIHPTNHLSIHPSIHPTNHPFLNLLFRIHRTLIHEFLSSYIIHPSLNQSTQP